MTNKSNGRVKEMKTETKQGFTPGPWKQDGIDIHDPKSGYIVASVLPFGGKKEQEDLANAALIAAAPELLERLKYEVQNCFCWNGGIGSGDERLSKQPCTDCDNREALIARAEGRQ